MNEKTNFIKKLNGFFLIFFAIIQLNCCNRGKTEQPATQTETEGLGTVIIRTGSLVDTLNGINNIDYDKRSQLITFINGALKHNGKSFYEEEANSDYGVKYSFNANGKYLFVTETEFGGSGSSFEGVQSYIFDTESIKLIPTESIFINANAPNPSFHKLVIEYLLKNKQFEQFTPENLPKAEDSITDYGFSLFYAKDGIGLRWDEGTLAANAAGAFEIVLPYSKARDFLTQTGKDVFK